MDKIKKFDKSFHLNNWIPNYFSVPVFRVTTILMLLLLGFTLWTNDWNVYNTWASCPVDNTKPCFNPFYLCDNIDEENINGLIYQDNNYVCMPEITFQTKSLCEQGYCDQRYLQAGETIGNPPNTHTQNFVSRIILLYGSAFLINHIVWVYRKGKEEGKWG